MSDCIKALLVCSCGCGTIVQLRQSHIRQRWLDGHGKILRYALGHAPRTPETRRLIAATKYGAANPMWRGTEVTDQAGRNRARRRFAATKCSKCGSSGGQMDRHHIDGNTLNNARGNVIALCRRCHMLADGRLEQFRNLAIANQPRACSARWNKIILP